MSDQTFLSHNPRQRPLHSGLRHVPIGRRKFLITSWVGATGLVLFPFASAHASPIYGAVAKFAASLGAAVSAAHIENYLQRRSLSSSAKEEVKRANNAMAQNGGFNDLSGSQVYVPRSESTYFFYPARSFDQFNTCVAFFDDARSKGTERIGLFEGPTLLGIGELAASIALRQSSDIVRRVMLPRRTIRAGRGSLQTNYDDDDVYETNEGIVRTTYRTNGSGRGIVTVEAKNERGTLLAEGEYVLTYSTA